MDKENRRESDHGQRGSSRTHRSRHGSHYHRSMFSKYKEQLLYIWMGVLTIVIIGLLIYLVDVGSQLKLQAHQMEKILSDLSELDSDDVGNTDSKGDEVDENGIPMYVHEEADRVIAQVLSLQNENTISFIAVSDMHLNINDYASVSALEHAGQAMQLIGDAVALDFAVSLGDMTVGDKNSTISSGISEIEMANAILAGGFEGIPNFRTVGNHDLLTYSFDKNGDYLKAAILYGLIGKYNEGATFPENEFERGYCYRDFEDKKLRVICLNTNDIEDSDAPTDHYKLSLPQVKWLVESLDLSSKDAPKEWNVLLLSHQPLYWEGYEKVVKLLDDYTFDRSGKIKIDGTYINYDFSSGNNATIIANIHGHLHSYRIDSLGEARIPALTVPNAGLYRNNEYGTAYTDEVHSKYGEKVTYEKIYKTAKETAFCIITIDLKYNRVYATVYGAGYDREIGY